MFESVDTHTDTHTDERRLESYPRSSPLSLRLSSAKNGDTVLPIIILWELSVAMETRVLPQNIMQPFHHPVDTSDTI